MRVDVVKLNRRIGVRWLVPCLRGRELLERQGRIDAKKQTKRGSISFFLLQSEGLSRWVG